MSASCKVSGIATVRSGPVSTYWFASSRSNVDASSIFVSSSTYSGTPSVLATMCCTTSAGQGFASRPLGNQCLDLRALQAVEHERGDVGTLRPGRAELWAVGQHVQHRHRGRLLDDQPEGLQRGGIGPVQVFPHHQHRLPLGLRHQPRHQRIQHLLFLVLRRQRQRRIALRRERHRKQPGKQRHDLSQRQARGPQPCLQFGEPGRGRIVRFKL